ncbi:MAG TPA: porin, partial [Myxococcaceae bacterium]|nr:porin [Myxococcaceae bacterium]
MTPMASYRSVLPSLLSGATLLLSPLSLAQQEQATQPPASEPSQPAQPPEAAPPAAAPTPEATPPAEAKKEKEKEKESAWYERIKLRGYTQFRYNRLPSFRRNDELINDQGDRFLGKNNNFGIRRARLILFGEVHEHVSIYLQPDFASVIGEQFHVAILRDWYADIFLDKKKEFRLRLGQSKVPFGFENLQSSQNRPALDRNDALNSALRDERDLGGFFYWAPAEIRQRFADLANSKLKGSGDYGVVGFGVFNGQNANRPERNDNLHAVGRVTWPFLFGKQYVEVGAQGYYGRYNVATGTGYTIRGGNDMVDARAAATLVIYPQPFGLMAEYNVGRGPSLGEGDERTVVASRALQGGYAQLMYRLDNVLGGSLVSYVRGTYYEGGKKFETNAPRYRVREAELGVEWQILKALEVTGAYLIS